jgi:nucleoside-diphosphate-sugar epimerase
MSLIGKKILVIGGNGFAGNYFASRLVKESAVVYAMSRYEVDNLEKD